MAKYRLLIDTIDGRRREPLVEMTDDEVDELVRVVKNLFPSSFIALGCLDPERFDFGLIPVCNICSFGILRLTDRHEGVFEKVVVGWGEGS